jgi:hypothetical protein
VVLGHLTSRPHLRLTEPSGDGARVIEATHEELGRRLLHCESNVAVLFTENETNTQRVFGAPIRVPYVKDVINNYLVQGQRDAVNPAQVGTRSCGQQMGEFG